MRKIVFAYFMLIVAVLHSETSFGQWQLTGNSNATSTSVLGTTNAFPLNLVTKNLSRIFIDTSGRVGIGTTSPANIFAVKTSGGTVSGKFAIGGSALFMGYGENAVGNSDHILNMASNIYNARPSLILKRARGTLSIPTAVATNDFVGTIGGTAFDGNNFQSSAAVDFFVDGTPTTGNVPVRVSISTGTNSTTRAERLRVLSSGDIQMNGTQMYLQRSSNRIGIGTTAPLARLDINGSVRIADGTQGAGKVLVSDASGIATWTGLELLPAGTAGQTLRHNGTAWTANNLLFNNGTNIGVGETNPQGLLHVSQPYNNVSTPQFEGTGLNDLSANNSGYTGTNFTRYIVRIASTGNPDYIEISTDDGTTWSPSQQISNPISLSNGVTASFGSVSGHTFGDRWSWAAGSGFANTLVVNNGKVAIGKAVATTTLDVNGDVLLKSVNTLSIGRGVSNHPSNTLLGYNSSSNNKYSRFNTSVGYNTLSADTIGSGNTAIGGFCLFSNISGSNNTAIGGDALHYSTAADQNTAIGSSALLYNQSGYGNVGVGNYSLQWNSGGSYNAAIGIGAGDGTDEPSNCTFLGSNTSASGYLTNTTVIGSYAYATASNSVRIGNNSVTSIGGQVNWTAFSDGRFKQNVQENVPGLAFITKLRPVTYNLNVEGIDKFYRDNNRGKGDLKYKRHTADDEANKQKSKIQYTGFLAQEVEVAAKELKYDFSGVDVPKNNKDYYGLRYAEFVVPLVKAVQELSKENEELKAKASKIDNLQKQIDELKEVMLKLVSAKTPCTTSK